MKPGSDAGTDGARQRLDKWLWAARFFKTRSLAAEAIAGGKVKVNGHAAKPAKDVKPGDVLDLTIGPAQWTVSIVALNDYRRPAPEARALYAESDDSRRRRETAAVEQAQAPAPGTGLKGRPTKRDRRRIERFSG